MNLKIATLITLIGWGLYCILDLIMAILMFDMSRTVYTLLSIFKMLFGPGSVVFFFVAFLSALNRRNFFEFSQHQHHSGSQQPQEQYRRY